MSHPVIDPHADFRKLKTLLAQGNAYLAWTEDALFEIKPDVSGWSIGQHLYHLALANGSVPRLIERMQSGRMGDENLVPEPEKLDVFYQNDWPRGWESPNRTCPPDDVNKELLVRDFGRMTKASHRLEPMLDELRSIPSRFPHLYFGPLNALEWLRFLPMHCRHHLLTVEKIAKG